MRTYYTGYMWRHADRIVDMHRGGATYEELACWLVREGSLADTLRQTWESPEMSQKEMIERVCSVARYIVKKAGGKCVTPKHLAMG